MTAVRWALADGWTVVRRNLAYLRHSPGILVATLTAPVTMTVLFGYVFGSAIAVPGGGNYREYLIPGLFAMVGATGIMPTMVGIAADVEKGVVDRLRAMPMARSAVPFGQAGSDIITGTAALALMALCGLAVGWRVRHGPGPALAAFGLLILFRYAMTWIGVFLGLAVKDERTANQLAVLVFPVSMLTNAFVPTAGMPAWLRTVADWNPISAVVAAGRDLFGNPTAPTAHPAWPLQHPVAASLAWSLLLLAIFVPLSVNRYRRAGS